MGEQVILTHVVADIVSHYGRHIYMHNVAQQSYGVQRLFLSTTYYVI